MKTLFLDANIFLYALGAEGPHREGCRLLLSAVGEGRLGGVTDAEVLQEVLHVRKRRFSSGDAASAVEAAATLVREVLPVAGEDVVRAGRLLLRHQRLSVRDALHAAVMEAHDIHLIVSLDADFDQVPTLRRLSPSVALGLRH